MTSTNIDEVVINFQKNKDKNSEAQLLENFYLAGCLYAKKFVRFTTYSDLLQIDEGEIDSLVYLALRKAALNYDPNHPKMASFQSYFFQMIKYQVYLEMKSSFNSGTISNYQKLCKFILKDESDNDYTEGKVIKKLSTKERMRRIDEFLLRKHQSYHQIWFFKSKGLDNRDIARLLCVKSSTIKSKVQYIKKLLLKEFPEFNDRLKKKNEDKLPKKVDEKPTKSED